MCEIVRVLTDQLAQASQEAGRWVDVAQTEMGQFGTSVGHQFGQRFFQLQIEVDRESVSVLEWEAAAQIERLQTGAASGKHVRDKTEVLRQNTCLKNENRMKSET